MEPRNNTLKRSMATVLSVFIAVGLGLIGPASALAQGVERGLNFQIVSDDITKSASGSVPAAPGGGGEEPNAGDGDAGSGGGSTPPPDTTSGGDSGSSGSGTTSDSGDSGSTSDSGTTTSGSGGSTASGSGGSGYTTSKQFKSKHKKNRKGGKHRGKR